MNKELWKNRDYLLMWTGQSISSFGSQVSHIVFPLLILELTHSPAQAGLIGSLTIIPYVALSLFVGAFMDRVNRKKVMIYADLANALVFGSIFLALYLNHVSLTFLYVAAFLHGIFFVIFDIAEIASLRSLVGKTQVGAATAQNNTTDGIASLVGPAVGATVFQIGRSIPFLIDTFSYLISAFASMLISKEFQQKREQEEDLEIMKELKEGISWLLNNKILRFMAFINAGAAFVLADLYLILIVLAKEQGATTTQIGAIASIAAVGTIIGSIVGSRIEKKYRPGRLIINLNWLLVFLFLSYILAPNFIVLGIITASISFIGSIWTVVQVGYRVSLVPDELQGRVNSVFRFTVYSVVPLGMIVTGIFLQAFGAKITVVLFSLILLFVVITASLNKEFRSMGLQR